MNKCQSCAKQFYCKNFKKIEDCKEYYSFKYVKDYGVPRRIENEGRN